MWYGVNVIAVRFKWLILLICFFSKETLAGSTHILLSFSMPKTSLTQWLAQAEKTSSTVHIRGFVDNSFKRTLEEVNLLFKPGGGAGILLDPHLFAKYQIEKVPAVIFIEDDQHYTIIYGDIGLKIASEIAWAKGHSQTAKQILESLTET